MKHESTEAPTPPGQAGHAAETNNNPIPGAISRRKAMAGSLGGLLLGALGTRKAAAQTPRPLLQLGGVCEGSLLQLRPNDAAVFMQKMLSQSPAFRSLRDYFVSKHGMSFILTRAKVFVYVAPPVAATSDGTVPAPIPNIIGILPSFKPVNRTDASHEAAGIVVHNNGGATATLVKVSHNPFIVTEYAAHELDPDDLSRVIVSPIGAAELEKLSVEEAAKVMGVPKVFERNVDPSASSPIAADAATLYSMALQAILRDEYARPLYPQDGLNALLRQASLGVKLSQVHFQRYSVALGKGGYCSCTCCNGCTTTSFSLKLEIRL